MALKIADRGRIPPFIVMDVMRQANRRAAEGANILHLEVGQPATGAPARVIAAATRLLHDNPLGYTDALGLPALRQRLALHYRETYGQDVDPARVVITTGASGAFVLAFLAAFNPGDRVALAVPGYPAYRNILTALGIEVIELPTGREQRYQPSIPLLDAVSGPLDGLILASPSNPAGTMVSPAEFAALAGYCDARGIRLVSDEIYHGLVYGSQPMTSAAFLPDAITINSFSKYFSMTGWRLGWMVVPEDLMRPVECLAQNLVISPPSLAQAAAIEAFLCQDELQANLRRYVANRAMLLDRLPQAGFRNFLAPDGAFYLYADIADRSPDSFTYCQKILAEVGVALTPGLDFDAARGHRHLRFSFAGSTPSIAEAIDRLAAWGG